MSLILYFKACPFTFTYTTQNITLVTSWQMQSWRNIFLPIVDFTRQYTYKFPVRLNVITVLFYENEA